MATAEPGIPVSSAGRRWQHLRKSDCHPSSIRLGSIGFTDVGEWSGCRWTFQFQCGDRRTGPAETMASSVGAVVALVVAMAAGGYYLLHRASGAIDSVAVLPLANATSNSEMDYLADGITEGVINHLSRLPRLRVMARSTVFRYRQAQQDPLQIGRDLKVGAVIVGRLTQHGDTVNVETEMVDVSNGSQIWGEQYQRKASDIATVQDDIASDISGQLRLKLTGRREEATATENSRGLPALCKGTFLPGAAHSRRPLQSLRSIQPGSGQRSKLRAGLYRVGRSLRPSPRSRNSFP